MGLFFFLGLGGWGDGGPLRDRKLERFLCNEVGALTLDLVVLG